GTGPPGPVAPVTSWGTGPPPPPGRGRRVLLKSPPVIVMLVGALLIVAGFGAAMAMVVALLFFELIVNVFAAAFTQDLRWYGPALFDWGPGFTHLVLGLTAAGSALLVAGALWRYRLESPAPPV
ncbi:MAG TPA: hypothetical protein VHL53_10870, partial [Acidimicrobiia bacterium]|nr:hypothetical protein [Acidimicrobiia bacterium]